MEENNIKQKDIEQFYLKAQNRANRWVKAWPGYEAYWAQDIEINWHNRLILFRYSCPDGIRAFFNAKSAISLDYIDNDEKLEQDSRKWKKDFDEKTANLQNKINELNAHPAVLELSKIKYELDAHLGRNQYFSLYK